MILITGASSGIGEACAKAFAKVKKDLFLVARREDRLKKLSAQLESQFGVKVLTAPLDVRDKEQIAAFGKRFSAELEAVTVLVNNAGLAKGADPIQEAKSEDWETMIDTNVKGLLFMTELMLPIFLKKEKGHFINLGSVASRWAYPRGNVYCATKRAVSALTEGLRLDLVGKGIRVTEISPGLVETEFSIVRLADEKKAKAVYEGLEVLRPEDVAEAIVWAESRPSHVNIQEMVIYPTDQASTNLILRK